MNQVCMLLNRQLFDSTDKILGEGTQGAVFKCIDTHFNKTVALKKVKRNKQEDGIPSTTIRELALYQSLNFPNIISLRDFYLSTTEIQLIFDMMDSDLSKQMQTRKISVNDIRDITYQLLLTLVYLHKRRVIHRDLKPQNILIDYQTGQIKVCDFGLAKSHSTPLKSMTLDVVSLRYKAPEILLGNEKYDPGVDVWAIGCIMAELALKYPLFKGNCELDQLFKIFQAKGTPDNTIWPGVEDLPYQQNTFPSWNIDNNCFQELVGELGELGVDLLRHLLEFDPKRRISAIEAVRHPFFYNVDASKQAEHIEIINKQ